jgi:hypothetical protein
MRTKTKMGMGLKTTTRKKKKTTMKKRILHVAKRGGILPILPILGTVGSLIGGAASVAKAVNDNKAAQRRLEELRRHNRAMEQGRGLYLAPYKHGQGLYLGPYKRGQGVSAKKKRKRRKSVKNAFRCNNECAIGTTGETYAHSAFQGCFYA